MRLFVAVNFDEAVLDAVERAIGGFAMNRTPWRWSARSTWHVTLKFLGESAPESVDAVCAELDAVALRHAPFEVSLGAFGAFPNLYRPRVLFYAVEVGADGLAKLSDDVNRSLSAQLGIRADTKAFRPHATVARIKTRIGRPAVEALKSTAGLEGVGQWVRSFDLMESRLGSKGAKYTRVKEFALG